MLTYLKALNTQNAYQGQWLNKPHSSTAREIHQSESVNIGPRLELRPTTHNTVGQTWEMGGNANEDPVQIWTWLKVEGWRFLLKKQTKKKQCRPQDEAHAR